MRHEQLEAPNTYAKVDIAAVWPSSAQVAPLPIPDVEDAPRQPQQATPAAQDIPVVVGKMIVGSYVAMLGAFALATIASSYSIFMITISALFLIAFFTVPWLFLRQERNDAVRPGFDRFLRDGMETLTGHSSGGAALIQMMIVPVLLTLGVAAIGVAAAIIM